MPAPSIDSYQVDSVLQNWIDSTGSVGASWSGVVPGFASEPVTWTLRLGRQREDLAQVYMGTGTRWIEKGIKSGVPIRYVLVGKNRFGDSSEVTGVETFKQPPSGMQYIPAGTFGMGNLEKLLLNNDGRELYQHGVTLSAFYMDATEVTQGQYKELMGVNPSWFKYGDLNYPVEYLYWGDAVMYCNARSKAAGLDTVYTYTGLSFYDNGVRWFEGLVTDFTKKGYRLPTEAEWEYACRGGTTTYWYWGNNRGVIGDYAWYESNSDNHPHPVATKLPNAYGLYDMAGNVWEWVNDFYSGGFSTTAQTNPTGPDSGSGWVMRGGSYAYNPEALQSTTRYKGGRRIETGFRCVLSIP